jgi:hypothetical protein
MNGGVAYLLNHDRRLVLGRRSLLYVLCAQPLSDGTSMAGVFDGAGFCSTGFAADSFSFLDFDASSFALGRLAEPS